jgi:hypothetical protein
MSLQKHVIATTLVALMASTSAFADNNNTTGDIVIQGAVPGVWELTVTDLNPGYDFNLSELAAGNNGSLNAAATEARVGTIHIYSNNLMGAGPASGGGATLFVESANSGRMVNNANGRSIADQHLSYLFDLRDNALVANTLVPTAALTGYTAYTPVAAATDVDLTLSWDLIVPLSLSFDAAGAQGDEATYDVVINIPAQATNQRPTASGVYSDTITFTIMDDN